MPLPCVQIIVTSGTWKTVEELRLAIQWNLDRDFDGEITRAEADEFLEMVRTGAPLRRWGGGLRADFHFTAPLGGGGWREGYVGGGSQPPPPPWFRDRAENFPASACL